MADENTQEEQSTEAREKPVEEQLEQGQNTTEPVDTEGDDEKIDQEEKLPFPTAAVVRLMKANMDHEKMIKKDVKIEMNKWLGKMCAKVSKEMNKFPYVMMHRHEFEQAKRQFEDLDN